MSWAGNAQNVGAKAPVNSALLFPLCWERCAVRDEHCFIYICECVCACEYVFVIHLLSISKLYIYIYIHVFTSRKHLIWCQYSLSVNYS